MPLIHVQSKTLSTTNSSSHEGEPDQSDFYEFIGDFSLYLKKYCEMSTLHGFRYLVEPKRPWYERCFWLIVAIFVLIGMATTLTSQLNYYLTNPMMMTMKSKMSSVREIPFPSISICSSNQGRASIVDLGQLKRKVANKEVLTTHDVMLCKVFELACKESNGNPLNLPDENAVLTELYAYLHTFNMKMCRKVFKSLIWQGKFIKDPCSILQPLTHSGGGFCNTFNMLPRKSLLSEALYSSYNSQNYANALKQFPVDYSEKNSTWSLELGYASRPTQHQDIPYRVTLGSYSNSATFILDFGADDIQEDCKPGAEGFLLYIHPPHELPTSSQTAMVYAEVNKRMIIVIEPEVTTTDEDLQSWLPSERGCYYNHERKLMLFSTYSLLNCQLECDANYTLKICNCSMLFIPHYDTTPVCGYKNIMCYYSVTMSTTDVSHKRSQYSACNCLPSCNELSYKIYAIKQNRNYTHNTAVYGLSPNTTTVDNIANVHVYFSETYFRSTLRAGVISRTDLIANMGGLLGLFLGFSVLSVFEMTYFCTIRWMADLWQKYKRESIKTNNCDRNEAEFDTSEGFAVGKPNSFYVPTASGYVTLRNRTLSQKDISNYKRHDDKVNIPSHYQHNVTLVNGYSNNAVNFGRRIQRK